MALKASRGRSRSAVMRKVRRKDTEPEMRVRKCAHALGYRYRLHGKDLDGSPDLVFPKRQKVIFVHGCFWHHHEGCGRASIPTSDRAFWIAKFDRNKNRDAQAISALSLKGWASLVIWECETRNSDSLSRKVADFLS